MNKEYTIENSKFTIINNYNVKNHIITKAEYDCYNNGKKLKYQSDYVSIIDVPYRKYRLV